MSKHLPSPDSSRANGDNRENRAGDHHDAWHSQLDVGDLLQRAAQVQPRETDPLGAVLRRHAHQPRPLLGGVSTTHPGLHPGLHPSTRRALVVGATAVLAAAASTALVLAAVSVRADMPDGSAPPAGPASTSTGVSGTDSAAALAAALAGPAPQEAIAHTLLVDACAAAQGVETTRGPAQVSTAGRSLGQLQLWLATGALTGPAEPEVVLGQLAEAAQDPYNTASEGSAPQEATFPLGQGGSVSVPVSGCYGQATAELYAMPATDYEVTAAAVRDLDARVRAQVAADPAVADAAAQWATCMAERGVSVQRAGDDDGGVGAATPDELVALVDQARRQGGQALEQLEGADAACKATSGLARAGVLATQRAAADLSAADRQVLARWQAATDSAAAVIAERGAQEGAAGGDWAALAGLE